MCSAMSPAAATANAPESQSQVRPPRQPVIAPAQSTSASSMRSAHG